MICPIIHDPFFLAQKSEPADESDTQTIIDLLDTLLANIDRCVGMAGKATWHGRIDQSFSG